MKYSIIIPNWNGCELIKKNLPAVILAIQGRGEVIVVDNGSDDGSVDYIHELEEKRIIKAIYLKNNFGFSYACNLGVKSAKGEIVVLLNSDVVPQENFLKPLGQDFKNPIIFAVSFHEQQWNWARGIWKNGFIEHEAGPKTDQPHFSLWASGGSSAFRKKLWEKLGGFDEIYQPFYWEDVDLSYRAWKRGYQVIWEPRSIVHHQHESTIGANFAPKYINFISQRNQLLFIWKNITNKEMMVEHRRSIVRRLVKQPGYIKVLTSVLVKLPKLLLKRFKEKHDVIIDDRIIFSQFNSS